MTQPQTKPKRGRPRVAINKEVFEALCGVQCTCEEIANHFSCSHDTVEAWCKREYKESFSVVFKKLSSNGKISLRRMQYQSAKNGSVPMQIWLGKQYLAQRDKWEDASEDERPVEKIAFTFVDARKPSGDE